jgi:hypothetical protein
MLSMRRLLVMMSVLAGLTATSSSAATPRAAHGPLTGTWTGALGGTRNGATQHERITITVNGRENAGTWKVGASCHGALTLDSISNGYHHYLRHLAPGSTCAGGDIDCLEREGAKVFDNVTPRPDGWNRSGTLHHVRAK